MGPATSEDDPAGAAWQRWTATLDRLGERLRGEGFPADDRGRAEGLRHLARQAAFALRDELEHADPRHPQLHRYELPWSQWGAPNPDNVYFRCAIDPAATYVLRAEVAGRHEALFSLLEGDMHLEEDEVYAELALSDLGARDGAIEITIGPEAPSGASAATHLTTAPGARLLLVRQYLYDWAGEPVGGFSVERVDTAGVPPPPPTPGQVAGALDRAGVWVERSIEHWAAYVAASRDLLEHNTFTPPNTPPGGAPHIGYGGGCWDLGEDEALVVEHDLPDARYWGWSIHRMHWFDSGDWARRPTSCNGHQAHVDADGRVRVVIARHDPGVPNWLDTEGLPLGMAVYRYVGARTKPLPEARVVPVAEVRGTLPEDHPVVDAAARREQLARRARAAQRRWS